VLDDAADVARGIAHDAPVARGIVESHGQYGQRALAGNGNQLFQGGSTDQGHVAVEHQHRVIVRYHAHGLHHRMAGAQLMRLQHPLDGFVRQRRLHQGAAMAVNHIYIRGLQRARRADHVLKQRLPGQRLQHFR
jgi:hypothetical protein